jgi:hypothetical protein
MTNDGKDLEVDVGIPDEEVNLETTVGAVQQDGEDDKQRNGMNASARAAEYAIEDPDSKIVNPTPADTRHMPSAAAKENPVANALERFNVLVPPPEPLPTLPPNGPQQVIVPGAYPMGRDRTLGSEADAPPPPQAEGDLTEARLVDELHEAMPVDAESEREKTRKLQESWMFTLLILALLVGTITIAVVVGVLVSRKNESQEDKFSLPPTRPANTQAPSSAPTSYVDSMSDSLPAYTLESLKIGNSPQWNAMEWLSLHPDLPTMEQWQKIQLFALATIFYAMQGPNWPLYIRKRWLDTTKSECYWFSSEYGALIDGEYVPNDSSGYENFDFTPCNSEGVFHSIVIDYLELSGYSVYIPPEIALITSLTTIMFSESDYNSSIADMIPTQMYQMANLSTFSLRGNYVRGTLPRYVRIVFRLPHTYSIISLA